VSRAFGLLAALLPSALRVRLLRARGAKIGTGVRLGMFSIILAEELELADGASIGALSVVRARSIRLGARASIGALSYVSTQRFALGDDTVVAKLVVIAGPATRQSEFVAGKRCTIFPYCWIDTTREVHLEDEVGVGGASYIFTHGSWQPVIDGFPVAFGPVTIKRNVWLPWRVFILPNVTIGEYATIGAGAVVTKSLPAYSLAAGMPAKVLKENGEHLRRLTLEEQLAIVAEALREAAADLEYQRHAVSLRESPGSLELNVDERKVLFQTRFDTLPDVSLLVSWERLPPDLLEAADRRRIHWFDFARRRCSLRRDWLFDRVRTTFSIRGIRFEPTAGDAAASLPDVPRASPPGPAEA
jgi:acetyltransferase-like isoleucine patch superfamily enzyme